MTLGGRRRVLVTRSRGAAAATARRIATLGHDPVILPLSRIVALACPVPAGSSRFDAVAVTSANALRHAGAALLDRLAGLPCIAVGAATARAAREAGFADVSNADGDVSDVLVLMQGSLPQGARIAYPCGRVRRPDLEAGARRAGFEIVALETYGTEKVSYSTQELKSIIGIEPIDDVLVYSANGAMAANALLGDVNFTHHFENTRILCISERAAVPLSPRHGQTMAVAARPDEDALLALL